MSDSSDDKTKDVQSEDTPVVEKTETATSPSNPVIEPQGKPAAAPPAPAPKRGSSAIAWLALILIIGLGAAAAWSVREAQRREGVLDQRLAALESRENSQQSELENLDRRLQAQLNSEIAAIGSAAAARATQLAQMEASVESQRGEIARFGATDRKDWLLAEAEYLLRLANQRLIMAGDVVAATALLNSADSILLELDEVSLYSARAAVAADLAALRAVPKVDVEGLYLRLAALIEQVQHLAIFELPVQPSRLEAVPAEDWQEKLQQGYAEALHKLSDYIVIRRRDVPYEALMDPQWERMVRQNMRMLLEQAQVALLSGNQVLFRESLQRTSHWVEQFFEADEAGSRALSQDIALLMEQTISVDLPDVSKSLRELDEAMELRLQLKDGV